MRSVRIHSSAPAMAPAPMPFGRGVVSLAPSKMAPASRSVVTTTATPAPSADNSWKVDQLRPVPSYYKLERSHLKIADASVSDITMRISRCLCGDSICATFNGEEAMVEAETHDGVTFTTRLFSDGNKVVVELQRQAGCSFMFNQTAKTVLRAAKGLGQTKRKPMPVVPSVPKCAIEEEKECLESGLEQAADLLKKDRLDAHLLAMESLSQLSQSTKCNCLVAKTILCGPLMENITSLIECWSVCSNEEEKGEAEEHHCATMHRRAIAVLANCLNTLEAEGELEAVLKQQTEQVCSLSVVIALVDELRRAEERPHDAFEAARCLGPLVRVCPECKPRFMECNGLHATSAAHITGSASHANLEKECKLLKLAIANCS